MSLTSYRAAPPRAIAVNPYGIYPLFPGFAEGKIPFSPVRVLRSKISLFVCAEQIRKDLSRVIRVDPSKTKGPLGGGPFSAGPKCVSRRFRFVSLAFCRPGSDLLSRVLRRSTIGAGAFHGRVRNGNGCSHPARTTRSAKRKIYA